MTKNAATVKKADPNWDRLQELADEIAALKGSGDWDRKAFDRVLAEGEKAAKGHEELLEFIAIAGEEDWL